jgi:hypothetical protein
MILMKGVVKNGVIILNEGTRPLPDGTKVLIEYTPEPASAPAQDQPLGAALLKFAGQAKGLPRDFARNHDHYIHGAPKLPEKQ